MSYKMSMQSGSWLCLAGSGAGLIKRPATFPKPAHRWRLRREPHSGHSLVAPIHCFGGNARPSGAERWDPVVLLHRRMMRFPKCVQTKSFQ